MNYITLPDTPSTRTEFKRSNSSPSNFQANIQSYQTLNHNYFSHLVKVENEFYSNNYTFETLDELVQLYAKAVEYFDKIQEGISSYFSFKIQDILATKRSLHMLYEQNRKHPKKSAIKNGSCRSPFSRSPKKSQSVIIHKVQNCTTPRRNNSEDSSDEEGTVMKKVSLMKPRSRKRHDSIAELKSQKQRFVKFFNLVQSENTAQQQDIQTVLNEHKKIAHENDEVVLSGLDKQKQRIQQKLNKRKNEKIMSCVFDSNSSMSCQSLFNLTDHFTKIELQSPLLIEEVLELNSSVDSDSKIAKSCDSDLHELVLPKKSLFVKSQFAKKEESGNNKSYTDDNLKNDEDFKDLRSKLITSTGKLSTENSFTCNEENATEIF